MKNLFILILFAFPILILADHTEHAHKVEDGKEITNTQIQVGQIDPKGELITVNVFGLVCDFCAQAIEKVFMEKEEVSGINVNLTDGLITISLKEGQNIDNEQLTKLILDSGYSVEKIIRNLPRES